ISPIWNSSVVDYLSFPSLGTLERICIYPATRVQMVAIMPERHCMRVGVGRWLSLFKEHTGPDAIEVSCVPQKLEYTTDQSEIHSEQAQSLEQFLLCYAIAVLFNIAILCAENPRIGCYLLGIITV
ncbi:hypothetical protein PMAYCL1PPCAC_03248, partial [Pristionchus mayeri]